MTEPTPMPMCPMAEICKGMMKKPLSRFALIIPGIALIILGVIVLIEPRILAWLVAVALIVMGAAILMVGNFMHRVGERFQKMHG